jgi:tetratricopeptide (TPR) repeat protein
VAYSLIVCVIFSGDAFADISGPTLDQLHRESVILAADRHPSDMQLERLADRVHRMNQQFPGDAVSHYWHGVIIDRSREPGKEGDAEQAFQNALKSASRSSPETISDVRYRAAVMLGLIKLGQGTASDAKTLAQEAIRINPDRPAAYRLLVDASFQANALVEAEKMLNSAIERDSNASGELLDLYFGLLLQEGKRGTLQKAVDQRMMADPTSAAANYYSALLMSQEDPKSAAAERRFIVASLNGGRQQESVIRSQDYLSRRVLDRLMSSPNPDAEWAWVADMIARYEIGERRGLPADYSELSSVLDAAKRLAATDEESALLKDHLVASLELFSGRPEVAKPLWEKVVSKWPRFVPAICRLAEVTEAEGTEPAIERANDLWAKAAAIEPDNPLVRDHVRFGVEVSATPDGVRIDKLDPLSPASDAGLASGDTIVRINRSDLPVLKPIERLRLVRLFTGGEIKYKTKGGELMTSDVPLLLLD